MWIQQNDDFKKFCFYDMSPRIKKFIDGINSGDSCIDYALLSSLGFVQSDGSIFRVYSSFRDYQSQVNEYKKGRLVEYKTIKDDKGFRYEITKQSIVSQNAISTKAWGGQSYHNFGLAVDLFVRSVGEVSRSAPISKGGRTWENLTDFYEEIGLLKWARECGLEWGGSWSDFWDMAHFQDSSFKLPINPFNYECNYSYISRGSSQSDSGDNKKSFSFSWGGGVFAILGVLLCYVLFGNK